MTAIARASTSTFALQSSGSMLGLGSRGAQVASLQSALAQAGFSPGAVDGDFGPKTRAAVQAFQRARGLTVDGVVGPQTWAALRSAPSAASGPTAPAPSAGAPVLRQGDFGADVQRLQQALQRQGFSPGGVDGSFGPQTRAAVVAFQRAKGLSADGVVGPATWRALDGAVTPVTPPVTPPTSGDLRGRMLDAARGEVGTVESGQNSGAVLKYPRAFGRGSEAYCADFVSWASRQAGGRMNESYCPTIVNKLKANGTWKGNANPQPGDLVLFDWNGDGVADHVGLVERVNSDGSLSTIEGNTSNPQTGQEGVWRRTRSRSSVLGFGAPW